MNIRDSIRMLAQTGDEIYCKICQVDKIYEDTRTIDCTPLDDDQAPILGVNLQANQNSDHGIVVYPTVGSYVVVAFLSQATAVVVLTDQIDKIQLRIRDTTVDVDQKQIVFNGGDLGGLIKIEELTGKLNGLTQTVNNLIANYNLHTHVTTATIGETATPGVLSPTESQADTAAVFNRSDYENEKVKH